MLGYVVGAVNIPVVKLLDDYIYDSKLKMTMPGTLDQRVVIIDIDEKSLGELGRWPWNRKILAELVNKLVDDYKVRVVGFDVVFAEPDESSGIKVLEAVGQRYFRGEQKFQQALEDLRPELDYDGLFAASLQGRPVVLGYYFSSLINAKQTGALPLPAFTGGAFESLRSRPVSWDGYGANLERFQRVASGAGHFNPLVDGDGSSRRVPLLVEFQGNYYESLSLAVLRAALGRSTIKLDIPEGSGEVESISLRWADGVLSIPVDRDVAALVPYRGHERSFPYFSAVDVKNGQIDARQLEGRIVLVGTSAPGLNDLRVTPVGAAYPGVEVHANLISGMLSGTLKVTPAYATGLDVVQIVMIGGLLVVLLPLLTPIRAAVATVLALLAVVILNFVFWQSGIVVPLAATLTLILLLFAYNMSWGYFVESRAKRQFTDLFGQYVPPALVEEMARDPERYNMEGRNGELTVLFADVRGFTSLSEGMDPRDLTHLMNEYLNEMTRVIQARRGTLDKYIGDAVMAFWGAPLADPLHATNAVLAAMEMQEALARLAPLFQRRGWPALQIGIGINSGIMTVGDMGSTIRKAYTVMGDSVNLGSRLEGITKTYGVGIVVGEATRDSAKLFAYRELDRVRVKGRDIAVAIYEPIAIEAELTQSQRDELKLWKEFLLLYRGQNWDQAELTLYNLQKLTPDSGLYRLYMERVSNMRNCPPAADWDGVTVFETK